MKRICLGILLMAVCLSVCACHGTRERASFEVPDTFDETRQYEVTFWAKNDTNKTQTNIYQQAIRDFEALYPNITVNMRLYTDYGKIYNDVITNISTGTTPDVCITYPDHIATYLTGSNVVTPLDDLADDPKFGLGGSEVRFDSPRRDEIVPEFLKECKIGGRLWALPYMRSTEACYVNKTYVEKLGYTLPDTLTWDFIWEVSDAAAKKDEAGNYLLNGQKVLIPFIYKSTDNMMIQMLRQLDAGYSTDAGEIELFNDTAKELLYTVAEHTGRGAFSTFKISGYPANFLNAGQCVFAVDSTAGSTWMGSGAPLLDISEESLIDFETAVLPVPQFDPEHPQMISQGPSVCVFNKDDPHQVLASWLFAQYLTTNDVQIAYSRTEGYVPVTTRAQQDPDYLDYLSRSEETGTDYYEVKMKAVHLLLDHVNDTFVTPVFVGSASLRDAAGQLIEGVTKSVRRKKAVDDSSIEQLFADTSSLYRLDQIGGAMNSADRDSLGPMPQASIGLLISLAVIWAAMGAVALGRLIRRKKRGN